MTIDGSDRGLWQRLQQLLRRRPRPRVTRLYGVGAPRTGTHSLAAVFDRTIRARHEPAFRAATKAVLAHHRGGSSFDDLRRFVRRRDQRLRLDVDSSHVNVFLIDAILAEFPDARFVLTVRDCYSWLDSAINHTMNSSQWSAADRQYLEFYLDAKNARYSAHDECLRQHGLLSVDCYLAAWTRHNQRALASVPGEKLLVVRTHELAAKRQQIAAFAGVDAARLNPRFRAIARARGKHGMLDRVDAAWLQQRVAEHCGALMARWFPHIRSLPDARAIAASPP